MNQFLAGVSAVALLAVCSPEHAFAKKPEHNNPPPAVDTSAEDCVEHDNLFQNPFSASSAHHRPIGEDAEYGDQEHAATASVQKSGFSVINPNGGQNGAQVYDVKETDPEKEVTFQGVVQPNPAPGGSARESADAGKRAAANPLPPASNDSGLPVTIRVPEAAGKAEGTNSIVVIVDQYAGLAHEFRGWRWDDGKPTAEQHREVDLKGLGHADSEQTTGHFGTTQAGVSVLVGLLRSNEINTPKCKIQHTLQLTLSSGGGNNNCGAQLGGIPVWPANSTSWYCASDPALCSGDIPYGALLAIPPDVEMGSLDLSEPGTRVAEALKNYGGYAVDDSTCPNFRAEQGMNNDVRDQLNVDMQKLWPRLRMVTNNKKDEETSGGGAPCAENIAFDSPELSQIGNCGKKQADRPEPDKPPIDKSDPNQPPPDKPDPSKPEPDKPPIDKSDPNQPPPDKLTPPAEQTWKEQISQWLWEHLPRTAEGLQSFREFLDKLF